MVSSISLLREFSIPLIAGIIIALLWANLSPGSYHNFIHTGVGELHLEFAVNELFMAIFFGIAAVEITDSLLPGGSMSSLKRAVTPLFATLGGVVGPIAIFFALNALVGNSELSRGWGITTATDIAIAWLVARLIFPKNHPAISFLLLLAIADDAIGLAIIAVFYPDPNHPLSPLALLLVALAVIICAALRWMKVRNYWPYLLLGGAFSWLGLFWAHLHPALALVFVVPFMPHTRSPAQHTTFDLVEGEKSTLIAFEHEWKVIVDFGLLFFGLVNAGVQFSAVGTITWLILAALLFGKTVGIYGFGLLASLFGFQLTGGMTRRDLFLVSMIAGIGLTVALFVASAAFSDPLLEGAAKMGALGSILIAPLAFLANRLLKPNPAPPQ
ncbi:MAG TPA: Na+/H+ antiporter NhaA [Phycisphaerae bacterium]|nr:Na+/H+ antiporter NhaA [Phycisphaerae bacterium]